MNAAQQRDWEEGHREGIKIIQSKVHVARPWGQSGTARPKSSQEQIPDLIPRSPCAERRGGLEAVSAWHDN